MRILYHHRIVADDGMRVHVNAVVGALRAAGHTVEVVGPAAKDSGDRRGITERFAAARAWLPAWAAELLEVVYNLPAQRRLQRAVRRFQPDVIYERYNLYLLAGLWTAWRSSLPLVMEVNAPLAKERRAHGNLRLERLARACEGLAWRRADAILPVSDVLARYVAHAGVPAQRIHVVRNAVSARTITAGRPERAHNDPATPLTFGFVGFCRPWHGLARVLDAMAAHPDTLSNLIVIGDGPARAGLEARARELDLSERLHVTGRVPHEQVAAHLVAVDIALQPDVTSYASPLKLFDYMAAGCAIVAPDRANVREILTDGQTGLLFEPDDPATLADALHRLAGDPALRARLGRAAAEELRRQDWTWEGNACRIVAICERLAGMRTLDANALHEPNQRVEELL
jgi:glycosyltransferase involved in cell wall biosynthesis